MPQDAQHNRGVRHAGVGRCIGCCLLLPRSGACPAPQLPLCFVPWAAGTCAGQVTTPSIHCPQDCIRWIVAQKNRVRNGELYRYIADTRGAFVQPALYEAFGLTVVEAMTCGLPTFATNHGGPAEIIKNKKSGAHPGGGQSGWFSLAF